MDVEAIIESVGYIGIFLCVFIECGVILGLVLPLPGFSLLFTAGVFAAAGTMDITIITMTGIAAAIVGYIAGYFTGARYGRKLFFEKNTKYFTPEQGRMTERFMKKYGYTTLIVGRFLPVMHSLAPILSGVAKTPFLPFMIVNVVGGIAWTLTATMLGFYLGQTLPYAQYYAIPFIIILTLLINSRRMRTWAGSLAKKIEDI